MHVILKVSVRGKEPYVFRFPRAEVTIGRANDNDLVLAHGSVNQRHTRVVKRDGRFIVVDLKSDGGTLVNRKRICGPTLVRPSDVVHIGAYELSVLDREPPNDVEGRFLAQLEADPSDDDTRSVYSDWLEEQGRPDEADFLRAQLAIKGLPPEHPQFRELATVIEALAPRMGAAWRRAVARPRPVRASVSAAMGRARVDGLTHRAPLHDLPTQCALCIDRT